MNQIILAAGKIEACAIWLIGLSKQLRKLFFIGWWILIFPDHILIYQLYIRIYQLYIKTGVIVKCDDEGEAVRPAG